MNKSELTDDAFKYIYSPERVALAATILEKEFRKLFRDLPDEAWPAVDRSVRGWFERPDTYHLSGEQYRDFWDSFAGVLEGIKLKPNLTAWITAENAHWRREAIPVRAIVVTHMLEQLRNIPGLRFRKHMPLQEVLEALANSKSLDEQKHISNQHSTDSKQNDYPIIVRKDETGYQIIDGNRRSLRAALFGQETIDAWIVELNGDRLYNYWIPLNDLLQLVGVYKSASGNDAEALQQAAARILRHHFQASPLADFMYRIRIGAYDIAAQQLYELASRIN